MELLELVVKPKVVDYFCFGNNGWKSPSSLIPKAILIVLLKEQKDGVSQGFMETQMFYFAIILGHS